MPTKYFAQSYQRYWWSLVIDIPPRTLPIDVIDEMDYKDYCRLYREISPKDISDLVCDLHNDYGANYWYVRHDHDTALFHFNGMTENLDKTPHYHVLLHFKTKLTKHGLIFACSSILGIAPERIDVGDVKSITNAMRYLVHYDDGDKFQYDPVSVITNDRDLFYSSLSVDIGKKSLTFKELSLRVQNATCLADFGETISLDDFRKYFFIIRSLFLEYHHVDIQKDSGMYCKPVVFKKEGRKNDVN